MVRPVYILLLSSCMILLTHTMINAQDTTILSRHSGPYTTIVKKIESPTVRGQLVQVYDSSLLVVRGEDYYPIPYNYIESIRFRPKKRRVRGIIYGAAAGLVTGVLLFNGAGQDLDPGETALLMSSLAPMGALLGILLTSKSPSDPQFKIKGTYERWSGQKKMIIPYVDQNPNIR